ncbi:MAG: MerR family transcriptional regulator [Lachnospiraceae bacterium]|nr:MerR family transcriptional regulator [Lachnospiraceae bacterium]
MSKYTTGEIAKLCEVTVRTVQYYDTRGILVPSELTEGGRRLYNDEDLRKMKIICFLRELDLPINSISELLKEEDPGSVISLLLEQQKKQLKAEIGEREERLKKLEDLSSGLKNFEHFSVESIGDIAYLMKNKKELTKMRWKMIGLGSIMDVIEIGTIILWIKTGIWWPFAVGMCIVVAIGVYISRYYYKSVDYICPQCHTVFKPKFGEMFWANHTPNTRKLTCTSCGHKGFCVETYAQCEKED